MYYEINGSQVMNADPQDVWAMPLQTTEYLVTVVFSWGNNNLEPSLAAFGSIKVGQMSLTRRSSVARTRKE